ncbi:MAG: DNA polymerase III subunit delta [Chitinophagales bacterium]|jgi:DNA polymerase-3 subunit delta|nr:DNA polymerase III subunit delta [Chitinophagales bacterium]
MSAAAIIADWKKGKWKPVYWIEGEEEYYIDQVLQYAEHQLLPESEAAFNLSVFYGRDAAWPDVVNACKRYPMFAERQVVLIKEAQHMRDLEKLESYLEQPLASTILVIGYKEKKLDNRKKFAKLVKEKGVLVTTKKLYESDLRSFAESLVQDKGLSIQPLALSLLIDHIGSDMQRIENELEKLAVNLAERKTITADDIERYIGISKEYNVFELQKALALKDTARCLRIIRYFEANPKAGPIQLILPSLYGFFSKVFMLYGAGGGDDKTLAATLGVPPFFLKDYKAATRNFDYSATEKVLLLLHQYNLRSVGIASTGASDGSLLRELVMKILL